MCVGQPRALPLLDLPWLFYTVGETGAFDGMYAMMLTARYSLG
jgi:hypothetical protein